MTTPTPDEYGDELIYSLAQELIWHADSSTSTYRRNPDGTVYRLVRAANIDEDAELIRRVDQALLERLRVEFADAKPQLQERVRRELGARGRRADRSFKGRDTWIATVVCRLALTPGTDLTGAIDSLIERRLGYLAHTAAEMIVGVLGTEWERRNRLGYPPDDLAILEI